MLNINHSGLLVPNSNIVASLAEFHVAFVQNIPTEERESLYNQYIHYSTQLKTVCNDSPLVQWIDGSFVTKALHPNDIDLVTFINYQIVEFLGNQLSPFKYPNSIGQFGVDAYIVKVYPKNHAHYSSYLSDRAYWFDLFDKTRRNKAGKKLPKGFLEITF